ncbi:leucine-rich repeat protein SHOC-2-like isoform X2 [Frankliniella occidentalis]|uniref:Leucine-rich repeat protein SHOC-2-like isoform X2 n=1 Tax=Frankliniella occidentalis TaxID=133901 RepID=A0A6J1SIX1_FRAOC|nr:leucine-rich repeat protein SHOC-2-like isoform X2 [Frankliniella occidentalis]
MSVEKDACECSEGITIENGTVLIEGAKLNHLTHMKLNSCGLSEIPDSLGDLAGLQCFEALHNNLKRLPSSIGHLKSLVKLNLSYNQLTALPDDFAQLDALETLNVSHNNLNAPPSCLQVGNVKINYLNLSFNEIEDWRLGPLCAYGLKFFDCANNRLKANPPWIWGDFCRSLENLNLSFNDFCNPSATLRPYNLWRTGVSIELKSLQLTNCGLTTDHLSLVYQLKAIKKLHLGNESNVNHSKSNFIWDISFKLFQSCHLAELNLDGVGLSILSEDISYLKALQILNCNNNRLQWLPDSICEMVNLKCLSLSNNGLLYIPNEMGKLANLQELFLNCNKLDDLPTSFADLQSLQYLDLYDNHLEVPPTCLETLNSLCGLDFKCNFFQDETKEELCLNLRKRRGLLERSDGMKSKPLTPSSSSRRSSYSSSCSENDTRGDQEDAENLGEPQSETEENWDLEDEEDEYFDPTVYQPKVTINMPARALIIHTTVIGPHSFIPSDIHPSPSIRPNKDLFAPDDGQFEDA